MSIQQAVTIEAANRNRQNVDYGMKHAMNKARCRDINMLEILYNDAKITFELYFEQLFKIAGADQAGE